ncbi:PQQ-binding-like beta-propeller repeat protein [Planctomycetaceae bacterium SH139]
MPRQQWNTAIQLGSVAMASGSGRVWTLSIAVLAVSVLNLGWSSVAHGRGHETLTPSEAAQIGMVDAWHRQLSISGGLNGLVDAEIFVDYEEKKTFAEVLADGRVLLRISGDRVNRFGIPIGIEEAQRLANLEVYKLKRRGISASVQLKEVPQVLLFALGADGTIECRDAEDGRIIWLQRYGDPRIPCLPMAVSHHFVTFVNADQLYVLETSTGKLVVQKHLKAVPLHGPAIVGDYIMCVCTGGRIEGYDVKDFDREAFVARVAGLPMAGPVTSQAIARTMWPTDAGYLFALDGSGRAQLSFRFPASGLVSSKVGSGPSGNFYAATEKGQVYGISPARDGRILWRQSLGGPVYQSPAVIADQLYVRTVYGQLYGLKASNGEYAWPSAVGRVQKVLGGTSDKVLVRTFSANLAAIDSRSGNVIAQLPATTIADSIHNPWTDRLYLLTNSGMIQCLRPLAAELPTIYEVKQLTSEEGAESEATPQPDAPAPSNPFGFGDDAGGGAFGGDNGGGNPFGTGNDAGNPFGGDNPFGG